MPSSPSSAEQSSGLIVSAHGRHVVVEDGASARVLCHVRGKRSDAVVGDRVRWQRSGDVGVVDEVLPRANFSATSRISVPIAAYGASRSRAAANAGRSRLVRTTRTGTAASPAAISARASCDSLNVGSAATTTSSWSMLAANAFVFHSSCR